MKKEISKKIASCKALKGKTILDIIEMPRFLENLAAYWNAQKADRDAIRKSYEAMRKAGGAKGYKLPAHVIDHLADMSAKELAGEFALVIAAQSQRSAAERLYINQIGMQAYSLTIAQIVCEEFPELEKELLPKSKSN